MKHKHSSPPRSRPNCLVLALLVAGAPAQGAEEAAVDKRRFNLFKPTPDAHLREMSTDRPDKTESAYTLDAGRFQLEMDLVSYSYDREGSNHREVRSEWLAIAPVNLKAGLLHNLDLQVMLPGYTSARIHGRSQGTEKPRGFGDVVVRTKYNLWGNDDGKTALGFMPYVKFPTNEDGLGNNSVEGGMILPLAVALPWGWDAGLMTQWDVVRDASGGDYHPEFVHTVTFGHAIAGQLSGYIEFFSLVSTEEDRPWIGTLDIGVTYGLTPGIQLDAGVNVGVTREAEDVNPFIGISIRF